MISSKKIILAPSGSDGDIFPMLEFAIALRARGHKVTVCSLSFSRSLFEENGFLFIESGLDVKSFVKDKNIMQKNVYSYQEEIGFLKEDIRLQFETLKVIAMDADYIFDGGYNYAAQSIAELYNIKRFHIFHVPNVYPSGEYPCMMVPWQRMPKLFNRLTWVLNNLFQNFQFRKLINDERKKLGLSLIKDVWQYYITNSILAVDSVLHQIPKEYQGIYHQTNYWEIKITSELPNDLLEFLKRGEKPFYFGLGSMPCENKDEILGHIVKICKHFKTRAILSKGWAGFNSIKNDDIFFVDKISHAKLFPKLDLVIHHGGPGTVDTASKAGNVQIIIPHILDQFYWGNRLHNLGVAPPLIERKKLNYQRLFNSFSRAYNNKQMKMNAEKIAATMKGHNGINDFFAPDLLKRLGINHL